MLQQIVALIIIAFFLGRLFWQKRKQKIGNNEFLFWLFFWVIAGAAILAIKWIDRFLGQAGFTSRGIDILFYLAVILLFYLVFKIRLRLESIEKNLTKISRKIAISDKNHKK